MTTQQQIHDACRAIRKAIAPYERSLADFRDADDDYQISRSKRTPTDWTEAGLWPGGYGPQDEQQAALFDARGKALDELEKAEAGLLAAVDDAQAKVRGCSIPDHRLAKFDAFTEELHRLRDCVDARKPCGLNFAAFEDMELLASVGSMSSGKAKATKPKGKRGRRKTTGPKALSPRQKQVLDLADQGFTVTAISTQLDIGLPAVSTYLSEGRARLEALDKSIQQSSRTSVRAQEGLKDATFHRRGE